MRERVSGYGKFSGGLAVRYACGVFGGDEL